MLELLSEKVVKTRKECQCGLCCKVFPKGSMIKSQSIAYDGHVYTARQCLICTKIIELCSAEEMRDFRWDGIPLGYVKDWMHEERFKGSTEHFYLFLINELN